MKFDTVITGGLLVGASVTITADAGIAGGKVAALGLDLPAGSGTAWPPRRCRSCRPTTARSA